MTIADSEEDRGDRDRRAETVGKRISNTPMSLGRSSGSLELKTCLRVAQEPLVRQILRQIPAVLGNRVSTSVRYAYGSTPLCLQLPVKAEQNRCESPAVVAACKDPIPPPDHLSTQCPLADVVVDR